MTWNATRSIQTASGSAGAEMSIQGIKEFSELRDFLYSRMRGRQPHGPNAAGYQPAPGQAVPQQALPSAAPQSSEALETLLRIHEDLAALRREMRKARSKPEDRF